MNEIRNKNKVYKRLFYFIVITLSISLAFAQGDDDRDYILIGCMTFGPIIYVSSLTKLIKVDKVLLVFMTIMLIIPILFGFQYIRWSSLFFSYMFFFYFLAGIHCAIKGNVRVGDISWITKKIIYAYAIVLILQQFCVLIGIPIINGSALTPDEPWKLNALSAEPSHTSRLVGVLMFAFIYCQSILAGHKLSFTQSLKRDSMVWIAFLWVTLTTVSGTAMLIIFVILLMFYSEKSLPIIGFILFLFLTVGAMSDMTAVKRSSSFIGSVLTVDTDKMINADHSASVRIVPWILCIQHINIFTFRSWVGEGMGTVAQWMSIYMPGVPSDFSGGGSANMLVEQGLIIGLLYLVITFRLCYSKQYKLSSIGLWILCIVTEGINMQMTWLCLLILFLVKYLRSHNIRVNRKIRVSHLLTEKVY